MINLIFCILIQFQNLDNILHQFVYTSLNTKNNLTNIIIKQIIILKKTKINYL